MSTFSPVTLVRRFTSLRLRALLLLAGGVTLAALASVLLFGPFFARTVEQELTKRGLALVSLLEQHRDLRLALALHEPSRAEAVGQAVLNGDTDVVYVLVLDAEGKLLGGATAEPMSPSARVALALAHRAGEDENEDLLRFTQTVRVADGGLEKGSLDFAAGRGEVPTAGLGTLLLGLATRGAQRQLSLLTLASAVLTAGVLAVVFFFFFSRLTQRLSRLRKFAAEIAAGNLAALRGNYGSDEVAALAQSLDAMAQRSASAVGQMQEVASALALTSNELFEAATLQSQSAGRQATAVSDAGAAVAELRATSAQAARRAQEVMGLAKKSEESTRGGEDAVKDSVSAVHTLQEQVLELARVLRALDDRTQQIGSIVSAVKELAEQSKVLALNASIEAGRAGEAGQGFSVLAREVRALAESSQEATAQVAKILRDIRKASEEAAKKMDEGTRSAHAGVERAHRAGESIHALSQAIATSSGAAQQIATSLSQQAEGVERIFQAVQDVNLVVNEGASRVRQLEAASRTMKGLSEELAGLVSSYRISTPR